RIEIAVADRREQVEHLVALAEIAAADLCREQLLPGAGDATDGQRPFRIEEVPMLPAGFRTHAFAGTVAELAGDGPPRRRRESRRTKQAAPDRPATPGSPGGFHG